MPSLRTALSAEPELLKRSGSRLARADWAALLLLTAVEACIIIWNVLDHSTPCWDTANHRLNSIAMYGLLKHAHARSIDWYRSIFTVSPLYPPLFYFVSASLKIVCGELAQTELLSNLLFVAVMFLSTYYIAREMSAQKLTAFIAAGLLFLYPFIFWSTHCALLDCAANAMVALGLCVFIWWTKSPSLARSVVLGFTFGLVALTKNNAPAFLIGPVLLDGILALKNRDKGRIKFLLLAGLLSALTILPWVVFAGPLVGNFVKGIQGQNLGLNDVHSPLAEFFLNATSFLTGDLRLVLSPLLWCCLMLALITQRQFNRIKIYLIAAGLGGILVVSGFRWQHQYRYITPAAIPLAIITAEMFANAWSTKRLWLRGAVVTVAALALLQFTYIGFTPNPICFPARLNRAIEALGVQNTMAQTNPQGISLHPLPEADWGGTWALSLIKREDGSRPVSLNIMPNSDVINTSTYIYLTRTRKDNVYTYECRQYAVAGDQVTFDPKFASSFDWYILTTGDQGRQLADASSFEAYTRWSKFIRFSHHYKLKGMKKLPDGSFLELYKKVHCMGKAYSSPHCSYSPPT